MKVAKISIRNILGIEELEINPGFITEVSGANGSGKTSCLEAIRCVLSGGHDGTLLRKGAKAGEAVLILEDGTEIRKRVTDDRSEVSVTHPQFGKISKPAAYIKKLADALSLNPVRFLTAPKKERTDLLLQAIPMKVTAADLLFVPMAALNGVDLDGHALEVLGAAGKAVYDLRTGVNRSATDKKATIRQMSETLPPEAPEGDWKDVLTAANDEWRKLYSATSAKLAEIDAGRVEALTAAEDEARTHVAKIKEDLQAAIDKLKTEAQAEIDQTLQGAREACEKTDAEAKAMREAEEAIFRPKEAELKERIGHAKAMLEQQAQIAKAREFIAQLTDEAARLEAESARLTEALGKLDSLKGKMLAELPIEGLSVQDGDILIDGMPFDRANTARKVKVAIQIAQLRAAELGLVAVDGLECLDHSTFEAFQREAQASGLQFVISRVSDGPLTVETEVA
jgi:energy-coupling factor transporter ATP-binding protein EcfA2